MYSSQQISNDFVMEDGCILAGIESYPPYTIFNGKTFEGTCVELFKLFMKKLGFCYKFIRSPNGLWGNEYSNGSWDGLIGLAYHKKVEIIVCPMARTYERNRVMDFSYSVVSTDFSIVYPRSAVKPQLVGFVMPFSTQASLMILFTILTMIALSITLNKTYFVGYNKLMTQRNPDTADTTDLPSDMWLRGMIGQPVSNLPRQNGSRLMMAIWLVSMLYLRETFKSNLKALLTLPQAHIPFDNLEQLVNQRKIQWSFMEGSVIPQVFKSAYEKDPESVLGKGWIKRGELYPNASYILEYVVERGMACISFTAKVDNLIATDFAETGRCRLATASKTFFSTDVSFGFRKNSKLKTLINPLILTLKERGILPEFLTKGNEKARYCKVPPGKEKGGKPRPLNLSDLMGIFCMLAGGHALATIVFLLEIAKKRSWKKGSENDLRLQTLSDNLKKNSQHVEKKCRLNMFEVE